MLFHLTTLLTTINKSVLINYTQLIISLKAMHNAKITTKMRQTE